VRRNRLAFAAACAIVAALVTGLGVATHSYLNEHEARRQAQESERVAREEAERSRQVSQFLKDMLTGVNPSIAMGRDTTILREVLDRAAGRVGTELAHQPGVEADLRSVMGEVYRQIGALDEAETALRAALAARRRASTQDDKMTAIALNDLGIALIEKLEFAEAEELLREANELIATVPDASEAERLSVFANFATALTQVGKMTEADALFTKIAAAQRSGDASLRGDLAMTLGNQAVVAQSAGDLYRAEKLLRESLALYAEHGWSDGPDAMRVGNNLAVVLRGLGKYDEALELYEQQIEHQIKVLGPEHHVVATTHNNYGAALLFADRLDEAEEHLRRALELRESLYGTQSGELVKPLLWLGVAARKRRTFDLSLELSQRAFEIALATWGAESSEAINARTDVGVSLHGLQRSTEAHALFRTNWQLAAQRRLDDSVRVSLLEGWIGPATAVGAWSEFASVVTAEYAALVDAGASPRALREIVALLVPLYERWHAAVPDDGRSAELARWRAMLDDLSKK
jgi:eukaryotic-like serine/threonine-protein kinase